jgi:hypothetical protein
VNSDALRDIPFEAAYLRAALLVGLHHERDVPVWAVECISRAPQLAAPLSEVLVARTERSAMREALRELADAAPPNRVEPALIATIALNPPESARSLHDRIRILSHIRREFTLPITIAIAIKALDERRMLADAGLRGTMAPDADEFARWIHIVRRPVHFRFGFENEEEAAAFIAALSRLVTRDRLWDSLPTRPTARAWLLREPVARGCCVLLNETAWRTAATEFAPLPVSSNIPYPVAVPPAPVVIDERTIAPLGSDQARAMMAEHTGRL